MRTRIRITSAVHDRRRTFALILGATTLAVAACQDDAVSVSTQPNSSILQASMLVGAARASFGGDGRFHPSAAEAQPAPAMSPNDAIATAAAFWAAFGQNLGVLVTRDRGGASIRAGAVTPCGMAFLAASSLSPAAGSLSRPRALLLGAQWIVPLCDGNSTRAVLAIAADGTPLNPQTMRDASPTELNATVHIYGLPDGARPIVSAEEAATFAFTRTGLRVSSVPRLIRAEAPVSGWHALWSVELESAVTVTGARTGRARALNRVWVGANPADGFRLALLDSESSDAGAAARSVSDWFGARSQEEARRGISVSRDPFLSFQQVEPIQPRAR